MKTQKIIGAMLGSAYGDALGWPFERFPKAIPAPSATSRAAELTQWTRHAGGRFYYHEETIEPGEHSDDTRLTLGVARSLTNGEGWWERLTRVELPFWWAYERGEGGASKKAAESWLDEILPWSPRRKPRNVKGYYDSDGDGAVRRILPHAAVCADIDFEILAGRLLLDATTTHGHPRALLGCLAHGYVLWKAFRLETTLAYGQLVDELIEDAAVWAKPPGPEDLPHDWLGQAQVHLPGYLEIWDESRREILDLLNMARSELAKGALCVDADALGRLQIVEGRLSGSGAVAAVASVFLASRHAPDPGAGVVAAATAASPATGTLASMTGGILGALHGTEWLAPVRPLLEDAAYIEKTAARLSETLPPTEPGWEPVTRKVMGDFSEAVAALPDQGTITLPDGRPAVASLGRSQIGGGGAFKIEFRRLTTEDGQTIHFKSIRRGDFRSQAEKRPEDTVPRRPYDAPPGRRPPAPRREYDRTGDPKSSLPKITSGQKVIAESLERSLWFYRDRLGLTVKRQTPSIVVFEQGLVVVPPSYSDDLAKFLPLRNLICVQTTAIGDRYEQIEANGLEIVTELGRWGQSSINFFRCLDPDGNIVEVFALDGR